MNSLNSNPKFYDEVDENNPDDIKAYEEMVLYWGLQNHITSSKALLDIISKLRNEGEDLQQIKKCLQLLEEDIANCLTNIRHVRNELSSD